MRIINRIVDEKIDLSGYGVFIIPDEIDAQLIYDVYEQIVVKGKVACRSEIKEAIITIASNYVG